MRVFTLAILAFATVSGAISVPGLPSCASSCVSTDFDGCGSLNVKCICSNQALIANLACCVSKVCSAADQETTIQFADALCQGSGVTNLPSSATCAPGAQSTTAGTSSGDASSTVSGSGSAAAAVSTASSAASSASASAASGSSGSTSSGSTASSTSGAASSATSSASQAATATANAGNTVEAAAMGMGALIFGALAAL